jgi:5-(carboxyamino)imidazole ribonucleotide synthase
MRGVMTSWVRRCRHRQLGDVPRPPRRTYPRRPVDACERAIVSVVSERVIGPGCTIGFLGGGQLGRMAALAARTMGYDVRVLDPDPACPAAPLATSVLAAPFDDAAAIATLGQQCDVVTLEIERVAVAGLSAAAAFAPVRPSASVLEVVQHRERQKSWLTANGFPVGPYLAVGSVDECERAVTTLGPSYIKASTGGYDGRGQVRVDDASECKQAWDALRAERCVVERTVPLAAEISVLVARRPAGQTATFPVALNHHEAGQLAWSVIPAPIEPAIAATACDIGGAVANAIEVVGLLAIEMFVLESGEVLVNELAPRPHNSFHHTIEGCVTSQFEQLVRAICDLPLGATDVVRPAAIANILGDAWMHRDGPDFAGALSVPGTRLHLYGKRDPRPARKMGHVAAVGDTPLEARARALAALRRLKRAGDRRTPVAD